MRREFLHRYTNDAILLYENIFFDGKKVFIAGSCIQPAVKTFFPSKKYFHIIILHHLYNGVKRCKNSLLMNKTGFMRVKEIDYHSLPAETNISLA